MLRAVEVKLLSSSLWVNRGEGCFQRPVVLQWGAFCGPLYVSSQLIAYSLLSRCKRQRQTNILSFKSPPRLSQFCWVRRDAPRMGCPESRSLLAGTLCFSPLETDILPLFLFIILIFNLFSVRMRLKLSNRSIRCTHKFPLVPRSDLAHNQ